MTAPPIGNVVYLGGQAVWVEMYAVTHQPGEVPKVGGTFTLVPPNGTLVLDGLVGAQGVPGQAAPIMRPQWSSPITEVEDLPDPATLDDSDDGRGWYIDGVWHIWADGEYHTVQGSIPGPPGQTPNISVSAALVDKGSPPVFGPINVIPSGPASAPNFHIEVPAVPGPEGPAGAIESAIDYDDEGTPSVPGDFLVKINEDKWGPGTPNLFMPRMHTISHASFTDYDGSAGRVMIANRDIPAREYDWYPDVNGFIRIRRKDISLAQFEIEVRIGPTGVGTGESDPICGLAPFDPALFDLDTDYVMNIHPCFSDTANPLREVSPDTSMGRVNAGDAMSIRVFIHKVSGAGGFVFTKANVGAQLRILEIPIL